MLSRGEKLPVDFRGRFIYYVGPVDPVREEVVGPAGPTTATRMDKFTRQMLAETGLLGIIGKAERGPKPSTPSASSARSTSWPSAARPTLFPRPSSRRASSPLKTLAWKLSTSSRSRYARHRRRRFHRHERPPPPAPPSGNPASPSTSPTPPSCNKWVECHYTGCPIHRAFVLCDEWASRECATAPAHLHCPGCPIHRAFVSCDEWASRECATVPTHLHYIGCPIHRAFVSCDEWASRECATVPTNLV